MTRSSRVFKLAANPDTAFADVPYAVTRHAPQSEHATRL